MMSHAAVTEIVGFDPSAVVVKGDLTASGLVSEYDAFLQCYMGTFASRLLHVRGNHDAYTGRRFASEPCQSLDLPGVTLAVLDTVIEGRDSGQVRVEQLDWLELIARRQAIAGYFAGHTHRNRVRRFAETGEVPYVEVACVKDFPGSWAEYRVFEGGLLQVHRRLSSPSALAWSEMCRGLYWGMYPTYALGRLEDRCFTIMPRTQLG